MNPQKLGKLVFGEPRATPHGSASLATPHTPLSPPTISDEIEGARGRRLDAHDDPLAGAAIGRPIDIRKKPRDNSREGVRGGLGGVEGWDHPRAA